MLVTYRFLAAAWALLVVCLSLTGSPPAIDVSMLGWDKFQHAGAYFLLALLVMLATNSGQRSLRVIMTVGLVAAIALGAFLEVLQGLMHNGRAADPLDALANCVGALSAAVFYWIGHRMVGRRHLLLPLFLTSAFLMPQTPPAVAAEASPIPADAATFFEALPAAGSRIVTFPAMADSGLWWTAAAITALGVSYSYDGELQRHGQQSRTKDVDRMADAGAFVGNPLIHLGVVSGIYTGGLLLERPEWRLTAIRAAEALFLADAVTLVAKESIGRARPDTSSDPHQYRPFRFDGRNASLPSLHTASSFALATVLAGETESGLLAGGYYLTATWVGVARVLQNRHWSSDVVLGAVIGGVSGWSVRHETPRLAASQLRILPLAIPNGAGIAVAGCFY